MSMRWMVLNGVVVDGEGKEAEPLACRSLALARLIPGWAAPLDSNRLPKLYTYSSADYIF